MDSARLFKFEQDPVEQLMQVFGSDTELECFDSELSRQRTEAAELFGFQQARAGSRELRNICSSAGDGANDAFSLEVLEGACYRVGIDAKIGGGAARGRQRIA